MTRAAGIVLITTSFPIRGDGSEAAGSFVADLAEELARSVPVRVVAPGPEDAHERWAADVQVFRFAAPNRPLSTLKPWRPGELLDVFLVLSGGRRATQRAVSAGPTSRLVALWALPCGHWARRAAGVAGLPYDVWALGSDIWTLGRYPLVRGLLRRVLRQAARCFADGLVLAEDASRICDRPVEFLPSSRRIDAHRPEPARAQAPYRLLFLGRWHPNKGIDLLLEALDLLETDDWRNIASVVIAGGGPMEAEVRGRVAVLQQAGRPVALRGYLDKERAQSALQATDYLLLPSRIESIPVVFSDALKFRCPVIATPVGDLPRLIGQEPACGFVAARVDAAAIAAAIRRGLQAPATGFAAALASRAAMFDLGTVATRLAGGGSHAASL